MYHPVLSTETQEHLKRSGDVDLVIGLPGHNNGQAAARAAGIALAGCQRYYPDLRTLIINADAGLNRGTCIPLANKLAGPYSGLPGPGSATAAILDAALALDAKAIVILESNTRSLTPAWVAGLAHLILETKADLVMPRYQWSSPAGLLNDLIAYPLFRALWGRSLRHPCAPDFALAPTLATALLDEDIWQTEVARFGLPAWLAAYGVLGGWRVAQSALGQKEEGSQAAFQAQFYSVMSVMLRLSGKRQRAWQNISRVDSLPTLIEFAPAPNYDPFPNQDPTPLLDELALGWMEYRRLWQQILTPDNLAHLEALAVLPPDRFYFPPDLWACIIYDFTVAFNQCDCDPYRVVHALYPLYVGRLAAFGQEIAGLSFVGREGTVAAQAVEFEELRPYLRRRWQAYRTEQEG